MALPQVRTTEDEVYHQELERVSLDWCMVYNPTDEDFYIEWSNTQGRPWKYLVPNKNKDIGFGKGKLEVQRYLAIWYCQHMKDLIVTAKGEKEAEAMLQARREKGQPELTKFEEQKAIWEKIPKTNSDKELAALYPILFLGVTREFNMDYGSNDEPNHVEQISPEQKILDKMKNKKYIPEAVSPTKKPTKQSLPSVDDLESLIKGE